MSGLKRKRDSEGVSTPKKRPATSLKHDAVKISWIKTGKNDLPPVLAVATGLSAPNIALNAYTKETSRQLELILHSSAHSRLDYIAKEEFGGGSDALLQHYIGVYDPETGELKLTEARKVALRSTLRPTKDELDRAMEEKTKLTVSCFLPGFCTSLLC
jgi:DNA-directed RNA polymerase I subunit RPA49